MDRVAARSTMENAVCPTLCPTPMLRPDFRPDFEPTKVYAKGLLRRLSLDFCG
jgi:hypothetical protein